MAHFFNNLYVLIKCESIFRTELYVLLCSSDVYDQQISGTIVTPELEYDEVMNDCCYTIISIFPIWCIVLYHFQLAHRLRWTQRN